MGEDGSIAVIPGDQQVCDELGLASWVGELNEDELKLIEFQESLIALFSSECVPRAQASALAEQHIAGLGLTRWTVVDNANWSSDRPCAGTGVDPATRVVTVGGRRAQPGELVPDVQPST